MIQFDLQNKVVFVFDGDCEIGKEIIHLYAKVGAKVLFLSRTHSVDKCIFVLKYKDESASEEIGPLNLGNSSFLKELHQIDIAINNLETDTGKGIIDITPEEWENIMFINLDAPFQLIKMITPLMEKRNDGVIINVSSTSAIDGGNGDIAYAASKSALESMNKALSRELASSNIRVNAVSVGKYDTSDSIPLGRKVTASEIANTIFMLTTPMASYINGQTILLDGGKTLA
ncbi:SDR family oxidoreductase [Oceanobacillus sp. FSL K6-2867]|uniref:SDR family NAD(P)-dependent oxidoreductase n=1 Tax=Oceanobacillus sp. FSL K6-2867 TaxID=2954748 RepID=UPI0030D6E98F